MRLRWKVAQYFEIRWWRRYVNGKDKAEYLRKKRLYWQGVLDQCSSYFKVGDDDKIIDVGCGPSGIYIVFPKQNVTAVDPLLEHYAVQLPIFSYADYPNVQFVTSTIEDLTATNTFNYVFCMNAINHVHDIQAGFSRLAGLAKPGGKVVVGIDAHNHMLLKRIFRLLHFDILHPHQYDAAEYRQMLEHAGCSVIATKVLKKHFIFNYVLLVAEKR